MPRFWTVFCLCAFGALVSGQSQEPPVFRAAGDTVPVFVTVTDRADRLITGLTQDRFTLRDNGRPQPITVFDNSPQPIRLIVLIDLSGSMYGNLPLIRDAGTALFSKLGRDDVATVGTFGKQIEINSTFTRDQRALLAALPQDIEPDAPTHLWRAILQAMDAFGDTAGRRVVLVLSDGQDSRAGEWGQKYVGSTEVVERAHRDNVMLYAVAMQSRFAPGRRPMGGGLMAQITNNFPSPEFGKTSVETGGGYVELRPRDDLGSAFSRIVEELHSQYLLGFAAPAKDGKRHEIEVRVSDGGLKVRARENYIAPRVAR
jgi:Ca-activated chloride channel homolog